MPTPAENALPTSDRRHTHTRGGSAGGGSSDLRTLAAAPGRDCRLPARTRRILHLDVDAFLASVEQAVHPELAGLAVVIGGMPHERNLVMSCSYPARACGVKPGMLLPEAHRLCPHAIFRRGDSQEAKRLREAVAHVLMRVTPLVEVASIDDFFADLTGTTRAQGDAFTVAECVRGWIRAELSLPVTIGIGSNRTMARLAGKLAKPGGIGEILPGHETAFLRYLPLEHLPGAGHQIGRMLERFGITRAGELALVPREILFASFGSLGLQIHERARGIDPEPVEATFTQDAAGKWIERMPRSIRRDSTFEPEEGRREIVEAMVGYMVERAAHKLRGHRAVARAIAVRVQYVDTRSRPGDHPSAKPRADPMHFERRVKLSPPTDSTDALLGRALAIWRELPRRRALVKRVGITLVDLSRAGGWQRSLFDDVTGTASVAVAEGVEAGQTGSRGSRADRQRRLDIALDAVRARHGFGRILRGTSVPLGTSHELLPDGYRLRTPSLNQ